MLKFSSITDIPFFAVYAASTIGDLYVVDPRDGTVLR
jgi:hypothetical protein